GGHFGYAYMDVASACSNILATAPYCIETNSLLLNAPYGFQTYNWYNSDFSSVVGSGQTVTISPPPVTSGVFYVDVIPYPGFGCRDTLQAFVMPLPVPDTPVTVPAINLCQFQYAGFLTAKASPGNQLMWYTSDTLGIPAFDAPQLSTSTAGKFKYYVSQKALMGCEGFKREITVNVIPTPVVSFSVNSSRQCQNGNNFIFSSHSTNLNDPGYIWDFGDGQTYTSTDTFSVYSYPSSGNFPVKLKAINGNTCAAEKTQIVTVVPKPIASFAYPSIICENQTMINLTDRSAVTGGVASINNWWWDINGKIVQGQSPASFTATGGSLPVKQVVSTTEGCRSDTNSTSLNVHFAPLAAFDIKDLLCENEVIRFIDQSLMPTGTGGEIISKWYWTFDNSLTASAQNPATNFNHGTHIARLISETSNGCKSIESVRNFEIQSKPVIKLEINDSCVFVPVTYKANDLAGNVVQWDWNFGNGFRKGPASITTSYNAEGNRPFTLITHTDKGCKDTLYRPFTIFGNKSFAGKDTVAAIGEPVQLFARGEPNMQYKWSPSTGLDHWDIEMPIANYDRDQTYQLYTITDKGCGKQSQIFIKRYVGPELFVPNAFTPNHDGLNDLFKITPIGIKSFGYLAVYDRWGNQIFYTTDYHNGWDGTFKGATLSTGTFIYVAQAIDYRGKQLFRKGTVTLIK
ncbi:MAG TPA: PKD domain-containing protein, partial [Flavisolibacter sp.]|nr:PKD domain-containing protein [Flavisolibacter sp.]